MPPAVVVAAWAAGTGLVNVAVGRDPPLRSLGDKDLDRQRVIDYVAAEVRIVAVRLGTLVGPLCLRQQRVAAGLRRRGPVVFPAPPCVPVDRVEEIALDPGGAAIEADPDLGDLGIPCPCGTADRVGTAGVDGFLPPPALEQRSML